ncbi:MAG TPA: hypothetical protein VHW44_17715 [Pseudonocardiaceae bacterium]|nr:hypothetical protein [Pseudonocardiaceae bacterium]
MSRRSLFRLGAAAVPALMLLGSSTSAARADTPTPARPTATTVAAQPPSPFVYFC